MSSLEEETETETGPQTTSLRCSAIEAMGPVLMLTSSFCLDLDSPSSLMEAPDEEESDG